MSVTVPLILALAFGAAPSLASRLHRLEEISRALEGRVGIAIELLETKEHYAVHGDERFPMQSVYKLPIAMAVLRVVDSGSLRLDQRVLVRKADLVPRPLGSPIRDAHPDGEVVLTIDELLRAMLVESDGTASDVLLRLIGGPQRATEYVRTLGVGGVVVATTEEEMSHSEEVQYRNWATPNAAAALLRAVQEDSGLSETSRARLLQDMTQSRTGPRRLKGFLPPKTPVAHKTGTSRTVDGLTRATNDIGLITLPDGRHMAVGVFVCDSTADEHAREGVIAAVAREAWGWWAGR
jgi:beta-lactamase class A